MSAPATGRVTGGFTRIVAIASVATIVVGCLTLLGWLFGIGVLKTMVPGAAAMMPWTAVCFICCGIALRLHRGPKENTDRTSRWLTLAGRMAASIALAMGLAMLTEHVTSHDLGFDRLLFPQALANDPASEPGRMSPATSFSFAVLGLALLSVGLKPGRGSRLSQCLSLVVIFVGVLGAEEFIFGVTLTDRAGAFAAMALHSALLFVLLGVGTLLARPKTGIVGSISGALGGGTMPRGILPIVLGLPIVVGWLQLQGERAGWYSHSSGVAMLATARMAILVAIVWWIARFLNNADAERRRTSEELKTSEERLRLAIAGAGIGTWHWNLPANELVWSDECFVLFGLTAGRPMDYKRFVAAVHPLDRAYVHDTVMRVRSGATEFDIEYRAQWPDGSVHWVAGRGRGYRDKSGRPVRIEGAILDIGARKQAEESARTAQSRLEAAQERGRVGSWELNPATGRTSWSLQMFRLFDRDPTLPPANLEEFMDYVHPDDRANVAQVYGRVDAAPEQQQIDFRSNPSRGPVRYFGSIASATFDPAGRAISAAGTIIDITERKRAEERVHQINADLERRVAERIAEVAAVTARLKAVMDGATQISIIATNTDGIITVFNAGAERMLGYTATEMIGLQTPAIIHVESEVIARGGELTKQFGREIRGFDAFVELARQGHHDEREWTYVRKDGTHFFVSLVVTALRDSNGALTGFLGVAKDVTERRTAEERLRLRSAALEAADNGVAITHVNGTVHWVNPAFTRLTGYAADEAIGQHTRILKSDYHPKEFYTALWQTILAGQVWHGEIVNRRKDGTTYDEEMSITPVRDANGAITHFVALKQDITARKRTENELRHAKEAAEAATQAKSDFLAVMSHEIRTPINGVTGMTGLLLDTELSTKQRNYAESIQASADALLSIINDILDFSKIEARKLVFETLDFDLRTIVEDTLAVLAPRAHAKGLELAGAVHPDVPVQLRGDPGRLRQILTNLASNAIKFTESGEVVVRVVCETETETHVRLRFVVRDSGIGISQEAQRRLFQRFSQADVSTTRRFGGTGLGLAISRQLVEMMDGRIGVVSDKGKGSLFHFTVRLAKQPGALHARDSSLELGDARVLIVDDNVTTCDLLEQQLHAWRMRCVCVTSGDAALHAMREAAAAHDPFAVALIDSAMAGMNGLAVARAVKRDATLGSVKLIALVEIGQTAADDAFRSAGFTGIATKPVKQSLLFDCIANTLKGEGPTAHRIAAPANGRSLELLEHARHIRIVLAEDNPINQQVGLGQLEKLGCRADVVANGLEVIEALRRIRYDVVLMDCMMPEMDGFEATARIRQLERESAYGFDGRPVHIIALTANAMSGDREKCLAAGMNDYVSKPVHVAELRRALEQWQPGEPDIPGTNASSPTNALVDVAGGDDAQFAIAPEIESETAVATIEEPTQADASPVELERLTELFEGENERLRRLLESYVAQGDETYTRLALAIRAGALKDVRQHAHKFVGASANLGVVAVVPTLRALETMVDNNCLTGAEAVLAESTRQWQRARQFLEQHQRTL